MAEFIYVAQNKMGRKVKGKLKAANEADARAQIKAKRYEIESLQENLGMLARFDKVVSRFRPYSLTELAVCTRQLAVMGNAGIAVSETLDMLSNQPLNETLHRAWSQVARDVVQGNYLSASLSRHHEIFGSLYIGMAKAGEASGTLTQNLERVADHLEKQVAIQHKVRAALSYPILVFVVCIAMAVLIVQHVLPELLNGLFTSAGIELPLITRVLIAGTALCNDPRVIAIALTLAAGAFAMIRGHLRTPEGRLQLQQALLRTPVLRGVIVKLLTVRFCRTASSLLRGGLSVPQTLELTAISVDSLVLHDYLITAIQDLKDGHPLARCMRAIPLFPVMLNSFVELGEETGKLPYLMDRLAELFEEDLDVALTNFTRLIEPIMVAVMGSFVAFVLIAIFIPLYKILGSF